MTDSVALAAQRARRRPRQRSESSETIPPQSARSRPSDRHGRRPPRLSYASGRYVCPARPRHGPSSAGRGCFSWPGAPPEAVLAAVAAEAGGGLDADVAGWNEPVHAHGRRRRSLARGPRAPDPEPLLPAPEWSAENGGVARGWSSRLKPARRVVGGLLPKPRRSRAPTSRSNGGLRGERQVVPIPYPRSDCGGRAQPRGLTRLTNRCPPPPPPPPPVDTESGLAGSPELVAAAIAKRRGPGL